MKISLIEKIFGTFFLLGAIASAYVAFAAQDNSSLLGIFAIFVLICSVLGIGLFLHARKLDAQKSPEPLTSTNSPVYAAPISIMDKQKELLSDWDDTNKKRDKLKMLKIAAAAQKQAAS